MKITIIGTGYVGLVSGTCFAETGNQVICVDIDHEKVIKMKEGIMPIYEPGLEVLFERNIKQDRLHFTTHLAEGIKDAEIIFLALPTPPGADGSADLSYVLGVAEELGNLITDYKVIVDKSTVPVGTAEKVANRLAKKLDRSLFDVVSNPEFLREGVAVQDFMKPERVVIGSSSDRARATMRRLYEPFVRQGNPIIFMDEKSAELTKYAANSFLATKISFMNEIANLCEKVGADVDQVRKGLGTDSRIGKRFLFPGVGYGGSCFPKDVKALHKTATEFSYDFKILEAVMDINAIQKLRIADKIIDYYDGRDESKSIAIWGLSFKPNTDDIREAPALYTINKLLNHGFTIRVYDPEAIENVKAALGDKVIYASNPYQATEGADALAIMTEWNVFRTPDFEQLSKLLKQKLIFDGRNLYDLDHMQKLGFSYYSIGRADIHEA
jgi:UDPglucose 6-dehydrogenase